GFMADPRGHDQREKGFETNYSSTGITVTHDGGYEYMQFMALKDIDFSETPYSVVVARDGVYRVTPAGWAEGGSTTFKFNLTKGTVEKGSFFYVGSASKVIAGYWPKGKSTDISDANWIRALEIQLGDSDATAGDGFGRSTTAL